ncbi:MAG: Txe/YoeB family addiction module toxin [Puniceicoccales bacterium]|jgi:Txe/YoeB family toxin of toxin-antitoxin system|nr:Txe/YoeB family addiction module toxin [Puniceicoccales bacterium]
MVMWRVLYTKRAQEDAIKLKKCGLSEKTRQLIDIISHNPYQTPPPFEKLFGIKNIYSRRMNIRHRLVYEVRKKESIVLVRMMFKHYGD